MPSIHVNYISLDNLVSQNGYRIGSDGSVWSCLKRGRLYNGEDRPLTNNWRRITEQDNGKGYKWVFIAGKHYYVHRLVLEAFIGPCPVGMECRHFPDSRRSNNKLSNLSWATLSVNQMDRVLHTTSNRCERNPMAKLTKNIVLYCRLEYRKGVKQKTLAEMFNVQKMTMSEAIRGITWASVK